MQASAIHQSARGPFSSSRMNRHGFGVLFDAVYPAVRLNAAVSRVKDFCQSLANSPVVNDSGAGHMNGLNPRRVRFEFVQTRGVDHLARDVVFLSPLVNSIQLWQLRRIESDDHFATDFKRDFLALAKGFHGLFAFVAISRFE